MAKQDEISSTERLLELIRTDSEIELEDSGELSQKPSGRLKSLVRRSISFKKNALVVDVTSVILSAKV